MSSQLLKLFPNILTNTDQALQKRFVNTDASSGWVFCLNILFFEFSYENVV